jgi:hypothetical protein
MKRYLILILLSFQGLSQVQFETKVKTTLGLNERLRVDFAMNIDGDNFNQPSFEGFRVIASPTASESVMGKSSFEKIYSYYLVPNQKEILQSSRPLLNIRQVYKTDPVKITVTASANENETLTILVFQ